MRSAPLRPGKLARSTKPLPRVSVKAKAPTRRYQQWASKHRAAVGRCEVRWPKICTGQPDSIHHVIKRSAGGALMPSTLAVRQRQVFLVACLPCNGAVEDHPQQARQRGLSKPNPLRRMDADGWAVSRFA